MTGYGPPDDPSEAPTGYYDYGDGGQPPPRPPTPWYRKPIILVALGLFGAILLGLVIYLIADQTAGHGDTTQTPTSPTTPTTTPTTTAEITTTEPVAPPETTTEPTTAPSTTPTTSTSVDEGHHHHHHHNGGTP